MELANGLRLGNKEIKICEDGGNTKQFCNEVTVASLPSKHERVELDPGLRYQEGHFVATTFMIDSLFTHLSLPALLILGELS